MNEDKGHTDKLPVWDIIAKAGVSVADVEKRIEELRRYVRDTKEAKK